MDPVLARHLWPETTDISADGITVGGCALADLADRWGTPLYVFDEATILHDIGAYQAGLGAYSAESIVHYAAKALLNTAVAQLMARAGCGIDVVSLNEITLLRRAGIALDRVHFHGNATPPAELAQAVAWDVGCILVDNLDQLDALARLTDRRDRPQPVMLRLAPGISAGGHAHIRTGHSEAKFGLTLADGQARIAVERALQAPGLRLIGLHAHIGSQVRSFGAVRRTIGVLLDFATQMNEDYGWELEELCPGGGLAVPTGPDEAPASIAAYCRAVVEAVSDGCLARALTLPRLSIEPGRSLVARAGVAVYTVTGRKIVPGRVRYVHIDGGMGDNIRPALYAAPYHALPVTRPLDPPTAHCDVSGRYCESGDVLLQNVPLPEMHVGERLAVPASGAYTLSMASNYNGVGRPAVVLVRDGAAHLIQRRESAEDLTARDLPLP